ncbi:MAG: FadR family transcriptional regulator [Spirochaetes bacterium]|nr:FadR family transcriptional regulator [Spirochaetota bacterium]
MKKNTLGKIQKNTLHQQIVSLLAKRIINELQPGDKLPSERDIAADLDVNRATVREALKKLETLGLIEIRHGEGIFIKDYLSSGNLELFKMMIYLNDTIPFSILQNLLEIRMIIVPQMAAIASQKINKEEIKLFESIVASNDSILEKDLAVHQLIAKASRNMLYIFLLNFFNQIFRDFGYLYFENPQNQKRSQKFHRDLLEAFKANDSKKAYAITYSVLEYTQEQIYSYYSQIYPDKG